MKKYYIFLVAIIVCIMLKTFAYAFDSNFVHLNINENATIQSFLNVYMQHHIGFSDGTKSIFNGKAAARWIREGGKKEDEGIRWLKHFHDPLQPFEDAGFKDLFDSSLVWAQDSTDNDAGWSMARQLFIQALTTGSEESYAKLFVTLGQLTHLVSDKAVPAHVRDDAHPETMISEILDISHLEVWTKNHAAELNYTGLFPGPGIFALAVEDQNAPQPVSALWDTDQYSGDNPAITLDQNIGLAEFTNANFFSEDTVFSSEYPHPHYVDVFKEAVPIPNPFDPTKNISREYWIRPATDTLPSYKASGVGYAIIYLENLYIDGYMDLKIFPPMDKYVFQDYAGILVPRAVGYSAALIDYFFRGALEVTPSSEYVYSIIDGGTGPQQFTHIKAGVRNISRIRTGTETDVPEEAGSGELLAVAKYRIIPNYAEDLSTYPANVADLASLMEDEPFAYSASLPIPIDPAVTQLKSDAATEFVFDFTQEPIPAGVTDLTLQVVFKGTLGSEQHEAVAVGFRDLNEPQHITFWNDSDYFLLYGTAVKAEEIADDPSVDDYGYIWPFAFDETIGFSRDYPYTDPAPLIELNTLPAARYGRIILLTDGADAEYYLTDHVNAQGLDSEGNPTTIVNATWKYPLPTAQVRMDADGNWTMTPVYEVRGIRQHQRTYYMSFYPYFIYINSLPPPVENELGPFPAAVLFPTPLQ